MRENYGFKFWLAWILWFAGSLVLASVLWTAALIFLFSKIEGGELALTWAVSVFGSWFILLIPFMRKKEQIWKRLNQDEEKAADAWLAAMGLFVGGMVASFIAWSFVFRASIGLTGGLNLNWIKAVVATCLILLLPFLIWMYKKADQIFKSALLRQSVTGPPFKAVFVEKSKRLLPENMVNLLKAAPPILQNGHIVCLIMKDGTQIPDVFVLNCSEVLGVYNRENFDFELASAVDIKVLQPGELVPYQEEKWLRLDGRA